MLVKTYPPVTESLQRIRAFVRSVAVAANLDERAAGDAVLAASEASANAVLHSGGSFVRVELEVLLPCMRIRVEDDGLFDRRVGTPDRNGGSGRGLQIIMALMDEVTLEEGSAERPGTSVTMTKCVA
jgi:anti-sigma regulatory factor (Ser/Thr protein kinase)